MKEVAACFWCKVFAWLPHCTAIAAEEEVFADWVHDTRISSTEEVLASLRWLGWSASVNVTAGEMLTTSKPAAVVRLPANSTQLVVSRMFVSLKSYSPFVSWVPEMNFAFETS